MKIVDFILAEDVRIEVGNKHSLIGVYNEKVSLGLPPDAKWPFPFKLGVFVRINKSNNSVWPEKIKMSILLDDKLIIPPFETPLGPKTESSYMTLAVSMNPGILLPSIGKLGLMIEFVAKDEIILTAQSPLKLNITR